METVFDDSLRNVQGMGGAVPTALAGLESFFPDVRGSGNVEAKVTAVVEVFDGDGDHSSSLLYINPSERYVHFNIGVVKGKLGRERLKELVDYFAGLGYSTNVEF